MPRKPTAELYTAIGFNKHGKTELYRDLMRHIERSTDKFEIARGDKGMVMIVFTLPSFDVVFKVIRDTFAYPKTTTRRRGDGEVPARVQARPRRPPGRRAGVRAPRLRARPVLGRTPGRARRATRRGP